MVEVTGFEPAAPSSRTKCATKLRYTSKKVKPRIKIRGLVAAELGFEPRHTESESAVLPLHNSAKNEHIYYSIFLEFVKWLALLFLYFRLLF